MYYGPRRAIDAQQYVVRAGLYVAANLGTLSVSAQY